MRILSGKPTAGKRREGHILLMLERSDSGCPLWEVLSLV
jgi:hypothetical protein